MVPTVAMAYSIYNIDGAEEPCLPLLQKETDRTVVPQGPLSVTASNHRDSSISVTGARQH